MGLYHFSLPLSLGCSLDPKKTKEKVQQTWRREGGRLPKCRLRFLSQKPRTLVAWASGSELFKAANGSRVRAKATFLRSHTNPLGPEAWVLLGRGLGACRGPAVAKQVLWVWL